MEYCCFPKECIFECVCELVSLCVCMCVREREGEGERERQCIPTIAVRIT